VTRPLLLSFGLFMLVTSLCALAGPGRIDMIDGQYRFEVAHQILASHSDQMQDPALAGALLTADGRRFSPYSLIASVTSLPLVWLARHIGPESVAREHVFFSFTSAAFAGATAVLVFLFFVTLGVECRIAVLWVLVLAFATSMLPAGTTVFDQVQHAFFLTAAALLLFVATRRDSLRLAAAAGLVMAVAVSIKEVYLALVPAFAIISLWEPDAPAPARRRSAVRMAVFAGVSVGGICLWIAVNVLRFGDPLSSVKASSTVLSPFGNGFVGIPGLLVSPGKGLMFYSPAMLVAIWGLRQLWRRERRLAQAVTAGSIVHLIGMGSLSFYGGDWCWGPRYLVPMMPLVALGFPMVSAAGAGRRVLIGALVAVSFAVQVMGLAIDHHRFFYARSLAPFFWYRNDSFYFRESALFARPGELRYSLRHGVPAQAEAFRPGPYPDLPTYAVFGPADSRLAPAWMRSYRVFWLPRPWPFWMMDLPADRRPMDVGRSLMLATAAALAGAIAIGHGLRSHRPVGLTAPMRWRAIE
jgi:hypothetical protein